MATKYGTSVRSTHVHIFVASEVRSDNILISGKMNQCVPSPCVAFVFRRCEDLFVPAVNPAPKNLRSSLR